MSTATARARRKTRVESSRPITKISTGTVTGITDSTTSAKISDGIDIIRSTKRDRSWSAHPPSTAARKPRMAPVVKRQDRGGRGDEDGGAPAIDHPAEQVAADVVGAQQMLGRGRLPHPADDLGHAVGRQQRREERHQEVQRGEDQADRGGKGNPHHFGCLRRGLARIETMSATMFSPM
jgi:hypothetical protein